MPEVDYSVPSWVQAPGQQLADDLARRRQFMAQQAQAAQAHQMDIAQFGQRQQELAQRAFEESQRQATTDAETKLRAQEWGNKIAEQQAYQADIAAGLDPITAILKHPGVAQGTVGAAEIRLQQQRDTEAAKEAAKFTPGDLQGFSVLDPETKVPIPGMVAIPGANRMEARGEPAIALPGYLSPEDRALNTQTAAAVRLTAQKQAQATRIKNTMLMRNREVLEKKLADTFTVANMATALMKANPKLTDEEAKNQAEKTLQGQIDAIDSQLEDGEQAPTQATKPSGTARWTYDPATGTFKPATQ